MKGLSIGLIAAVLIGGGIWLVATQGTDNAQPATQMNEETQEEDTDEEATEANIVAYTDSGFSPRIIRVKAGAAVTWTNESDRPMWVASDVHPEHEILPAFDQLGSGDRYTFTFTQAGEWDYHDHLFASHIGTIIVE